MSDESRLAALSAWEMVRSLEVERIALPGNASTVEHHRFFEDALIEPNLFFIEPRGESTGLIVLGEPDLVERSFAYARVSPSYVILKRKAPKQTPAPAPDPAPGGGAVARDSEVVERCMQCQRRVIVVSKS